MKKFKFSKDAKLFIMGFIALILGLFLLTDSRADQSLILPVIEVYDGDTVKTQFPLPSPLDKVSIRILGIDTPEKPAASYLTTGKLGRAGCVEEAELALKAMDYLKALFGKYQIMEVKNFKWDKFGGRIDGDVFVNGVSVADKLIENGYARPYFGEKKQSWCM